MEGDTYFLCENQDDDDERRISDFDWFGSGSLSKGLFARQKVLFSKKEASGVVRVLIPLVFRNPVRMIVLASHVSLALIS
jgi:hypothetical protein